FGWLDVQLQGARYNDVTETGGFHTDATQYISIRPPLAAGNYRISLMTQSGVDVALPTLGIVVVEPLSLPAQVLMYPADERRRKISELFFDAETSALVLLTQFPDAGEENSQILRYAWTDDAWSQPAIRDQPYISALVPRVDGGWMATALLNDGKDNALILCTQDLSTCTNTQVAGAAIMRRTAIGMTNAGRPLIVQTPRNNPTGDAKL